MPRSAPSSFARSNFSSLDEVTTTCAPTCTPSWIAKVETPLPAPSTSIVSPPTSRPRAKRARYAVSPASGSAAASCHDSRCGFAKTFAAGIAISSANVPPSGPPRMRNSGPGWSSRTPHASEGRMMTSSPVSRRMPAPSEPGTSGSGYWPARTRRSRRLSAAARSSTTTSPGCGSGSGTASNEVEPGSRIRTASTRAARRPAPLGSPAARAAPARTRPGCRERAAATAPSRYCASNGRLRSGHRWCRPP